MSKDNIIVGVLVYFTLFLLLISLPIILIGLFCGEVILFLGFSIGALGMIMAFIMIFLRAMNFL